MIVWTMKVIFPVVKSYSRVHFTPLIWSVSLLAEGMDGFQLLSQTVIHQSMPLQEGLSLKLPRNHHNLKALATPTRCVLHLLQKVEGTFRSSHSRTHTENFELCMYCIFPSSWNIQLQDQEPCQPIK